METRTYYNGRIVAVQTSARRWKILVDGTLTNLTFTGAKGMKRHVDFWIARLDYKKS